MSKVRSINTSHLEALAGGQNDGLVIVKRPNRGDGYNGNKGYDQQQGAPPFKKPFKQPKGFQPNGYQNTGFPPGGVQPNSYKPNGFQQGGVQPDGYQTNGLQTNGYKGNGYPNKGYSPDQNPNNGNNQGNRRNGKDGIKDGIKDGGQVGQDAANLNPTVLASELTKITSKTLSTDTQFDTVGQQALDALAAERRLKPDASKFVPALVNAEKSTVRIVGTVAVVISCASGIIVAAIYA